MSLLGRRAWWMPAWLERAAPSIEIEGEEFFRARDAADAAAGAEEEETEPQPA
jgi:RND superfamily putative drug exporter